MNELVYTSEDRYDPNVWNRFPQVKPPTNQLMRIEIYTPSWHSGPEYFAEKIHRYDCMFYDGYAWRYVNDGLAYIPPSKALRFKPWRD